MAIGRTRFGLDRLAAIVFVLFVVVTLVAIVAGDTAASFTSNTKNNGNTLAALTVAPPATQNATTSAANGVVGLSWTATPTAPGAGHTLTYDVLRGPVGGPYALVKNVSTLTTTDTPPADGTYEYVIRAKVAGGGTFTSGNSTARSGVSDRAVPTMSITCNGAACNAGWYTGAVSVTVSGADGGTGMGSVTRNVDSAGQISTAGASVTFTVSGNSSGHGVQYFGTDAAGNASTPATQTIKIDMSAPTVPAGVTLASGTNGGAKTVELSWTASTDPTSGLQGYEVRWTDPITTCPAANTTNYPNSAALGAVTAYTIAGSNNSDYCAYVVAIDNAGNRSANSAVSGPTTAK